MGYPGHLQQWKKSITYYLVKTACYPEIRVWWKEKSLIFTRLEKPNNTQRDNIKRLYFPQEQFSVLLKGFQAYSLYLLLSVESNRCRKYPPILLREAH